MWVKLRKEENAKVWMIQVDFVRDDEEYSQLK